MKDSMMTWEEAVLWLRDQPDRQELVKHCYYDDPLELTVERFYKSEEWKGIEKLLGSLLKGKVLDIGAGRGISSYAFAKAGCSVVALEPDSSEMVGAQAVRTLANQTNLPIEVVEDFGETLPFADNSFDVVYGRAVLHHAQNLDQLCLEAARVLKPGGVFLATREHVISKKGDLQAFFDSHALHSLYGGENAYLLQEYIQAIKQAGLTIRRTIGPWQSIINYAPTTYSDFLKMTEIVLGKYLGQTIAKTLTQYQITQNFCGWYFSVKNNAPGRHYSFFAVKP